MHNKTSFVMTVYASATQHIANKSMLRLKNHLNTEFTPDSFLFMSSQ